MPLESIAIQHFSNNPIANPELQTRIIKLYDQSPEFESGEQAIQLFERCFRQGSSLYVGIFNDKPIACIGCFDDGQMNVRRLQHIVVHPANRGRGIGAKLIKQVIDSERKKGICQFVSDCLYTQQILTKYELHTFN